MELKPCPFCGGKADTGREQCIDGGGTFAFIKCSKCGAKSVEHYYSKGNDCPIFYETLRDKWNARTGESQ